MVFSWDAGAHLLVTKHHMMWHQPRVREQFSTSPLRLGLNSLCSLVCLLWVGAAVMQQQPFCSPGTGGGADEQFRLPDISSCLCDQRKS